MVSRVFTLPVQPGLANGLPDAGTVGYGKQAAAGHLPAFKGRVNLMKMKLFAGALALGCVVMSSAALADDPNDLSMRSAAARARDKAIIRQLNLDQAAYVRARDARQAKGWQAYKDRPAQQAAYERKMAEWRRAVRMCESGHYEYCAR
jgi:hypothetical protein